MSATQPLDDAAAAGLDDFVDEPERVTPEIVDVDTSAPKADVGDGAEVVDERPDADVRRLPVRQEVAEHPTLGTLTPLQEELMGIAQIARTLAGATTMPKSLQNKPADVLAIILTGRELGVGPMTAFRMFHVINGTVTLAPKVRLAMVRQQGLGRVYPHQPPVEVPCPLLVAVEEGLRDEHADDCKRCGGSGVVWRLCPCGVNTHAGSETDADVSTWHAERHDMPGIVFTSTYTLAMAQAVTYDEWTDKQGGGRAKITKKLADKDNWKNYPAQMCQWRALGYLLDQAFSEVGTGLYSPDEVGAVTDDQGEAILDVESREVLVPADTSPAAQSRARAEANKAKAKANKADDPVAPPDTIATFKRRIENIKRYDGAAPALGALWQADDGTGQPKLPPVDKLLYRHCKMAAAMIDMIEKRINKGDFGEPDGPAPEPDPEPTPDESGPTAEPGDDPAENGDAPEGSPSTDAPPDEPESDAEAPVPVVDAPFDPDGLPTGRSANDDLAWLSRAPVELTDEVIAEITALSADELDSRCKASDIKGNVEKRRAALAAFTVRKRMERMLR